MFAVSLLRMVFCVKLNSSAACERCPALSKLTRSRFSIVRTSRSTSSSHYQQLSASFHKSRRFSARVSLPRFATIGPDGEASYRRAWQSHSRFNNHDSRGTESLQNGYTDFRFHKHFVIASQGAEGTVPPDISPLVSKTCWLSPCRVTHRTIFTMNLWQK